MKQTISIVLLTIIFFFAFQFATLPSQNKQQPSEPKFTVSMTAQQWATIVYIVDNAPVAGDVRKPIVQAIQDQVNPQIRALNDTTNKKKKP